MRDGRDWPFRVIVLLLLLVHFTLQIGLGLRSGVPDLLTVAALLAARRLRPATAAGFGFVLGLLRDSMSLTTFAADTVTLTVLSYLGARSCDYFEGDGASFTAFYLFAGKWAHDAGYFLLARPALRTEPGHTLLVEAPLGAVYAAVVGTLAMALYRRAARRR